MDNSKPHPITEKISQISKILLDDPSFQNHWKNLHFELIHDTGGWRVGLWSSQILIGILNLEEVPRRILEDWISKKGKSASIQHLRESLKKIGCNQAAKNVALLLSHPDEGLNGPHCSEPTLNAMGVEPPCHPFCGRREEISTLQNLCEDDEGILNVFGEFGIGKTEFMKRFVSACTKSFIWVNMGRTIDYKLSTNPLPSSAINRIIPLPDDKYTSANLDAEIKAKGSGITIIFDNVCKQDKVFTDWLVTLGEKVIVVSREKIEFSCKIKYFQLKPLSDSDASALLLGIAHDESILPFLIRLPANVMWFRAVCYLSKALRTDFSLQKESFTGDDNMTEKLCQHCIGMISKSPIEWSLLLIITFSSRGEISVSFLHNCLTSLCHDYGSQDFETALVTLSEVGLLKRDSPDKIQSFSFMKCLFLKMLGTKFHALVRPLLFKLCERIGTISLTKENVLQAAEICLNAAIFVKTLSEEAVLSVCSGLDKYGFFIDFLTFSKMFSEMVERPDLSGISRDFKILIGFNTAVAYRRNGYSESAVVILNKLKENCSSNGRKLFIKIAHALAKTYFASQKYDLALKNFEQILEARRRYPNGLENPETQKTLLNIVNCRMEIDDPETLENAKQTLKDVEKFMRQKSTLQDALMAKHSLGYCQFKMGLYDDAKTTFASVIHEFEENTGKVNPRLVLTSKQMLAETLDKLGENLDALREYEKLLENLKKLYHIDHYLIHKIGVAIEKLREKSKGVPSLKFLRFAKQCYSGVGKVILAFCISVVFYELIIRPRVEPHFQSFVSEIHNLIEFYLL